MTDAERRRMHALFKYWVPNALYFFTKYDTILGITDEDIVVILNVITDYWTKTATAKERRATYTAV